MTVAETTTLDQVAQGPDGRVLLAMTEDRPYATHDAAQLTEDLRLKLNAYVYLIRSGQLADIVGHRPGQGIEIRLFCTDDPPAGVRELWDLASQGLAGEDVTLSWEVLEPPSTDELLYRVADSMTGRAPEGWTQLYLQAILVADRISGGLRATMPDGTLVPMQPDGELIAALQGLKRSWWQPDRGSWVTFEVEIDGTRMQPAFSTDEPDGGADYFDRSDWAAELERYPRTDVPGWWRAQLST